MAILSILLLLIFLTWGYNSPKNALWFSILFFPLLYPANVAIVPSDVLFLNINRIVLSVLLGVYIKTPNRFKFSILMKNIVIKVFVLFSIYVVFISLDDRLKNLIFSYIPNLLIVLMLGYAIIEHELDFKNFIRILSWHAGVFSIIVILDFVNIINISLIIRKLSPGFNLDMAQVGVVRAGLSRVAGWDGDSINSAVRLTVLFPIVLLNMELSKSKLFSFIIVGLSFFSIILLMSRAAYIGFFISIIYLLGYLFISVDKNIINKLILMIRKAIVIIGIFFVLVMFIPVINTTISGVYEFSFSKDTNRDNEGRASRIPYALDRIAEKPFIGWGSPEFVYYEVMDTNDVPSPIIYLLAGGVPLFILFIIWWSRMPFYFLRHLNYANRQDKIIFIYIGASMVGGLIPMLSNRNEKSLLLMIIIFVATYKYSLIKGYYKNNKLKRN